MRFYIRWLGFACLIGAMPLFAANPYRILVTGDSISVGYTDLPNWAEPFEFGFRSGLYTRLTNSGMAVQFVGNSGEPWNGGSAGTYAVPTNTPTLDLRPIGQDHCEGYGGKKASFILGNIAGWLSAHSPDIILLLIGINDIHNDIPEPTATEQTLSNIVFTVTANAPDVRLIVAQITPYGTNCPGIVKYNSYIRNVLVPYFAAQGKHVTTVDQYSNMLFPGTTNIDGSLFSNDINHPNALVYERMAQTWFDGIQALQPLPPPQEPPPSSAVRWSGAISGAWDTNTTNWALLNAGPPTTYVDGAPGCAVQFDDTLVGNPALTLSSVVTPASVTFSNNNTAYSISGSGWMAVNGPLLKKGGGTATLNTSNFFGGGVTVSAGTLIMNEVNSCSAATVSGSSILRASKTGAVGNGGLTVGTAQPDNSRLELSGGITVANTLTFKPRNHVNNVAPHFLNVTGTNFISPPADIIYGAGGDVLSLQSDCGRLVVTVGVNITASPAPRYVVLQGSGDGEVQGPISVNGTVLKLGAGSWTLSGTNALAYGVAVSNGTLVVNGSLTAATNVVTIAGGTLAGHGTIAGPVTVQAAGTLAPGLSVGKLTLNSNLTLQGMAVMEIARNGPSLTNDWVTGVKTNTYGGTLVVTNVGSSPLQAGDSFKLFTATKYVGAFANIVYPPGHTFSNSLAVDGEIWVLAVPSTTPPNFPSDGIVQLPDGNFLLTATGAVGTAYKLWASTNFARPPVTNPWTLLTNGTVGVNPFTIIDDNAKNYPQRFYRFSAP